MPPTSAIRVDGPSPSAPLRGLLAVAQTLDGEGRWLNGVVLDAHPCGCADVVAIDCDPTPATLAGDEYDAAGDGPPEFHPFHVFAHRACSTFGLGPFDDFRRKLLDVLDASQHHAIEREFWTGAQVSTNPHLADGTADLAGASAPFVEAFAQVEQAIADSCRAGVIHMTVAAATIAARYDLIEPQGATLRSRAMGTPVVAGSGYPGTSPDGDAPPADGTWIYATGPLTVRLGEVQTPASIAEAIHISANRVVVRAMRPATVEWDRCLHVAQLAGLSDDVTPVQGSGS